MRAFVHRASESLYYFGDSTFIQEVNTLDDLKTLAQQFNHRLILTFRDIPDEFDCDLDILVYDDYIE